MSSGGAFPTTNALRLVWSAGNLFIAGSAGYIPIPGVGEYVTHRCFWMMLSGGGFIPAINTGYETSATGPFGAQWFPSGLSQNVPYELQIRLRVTGTLQWQIDAAIFSNPAGARTLIRTTANFLDWGSAPNPLEGYTFTEGAQDQLNRLAGLTVSTEETEQPTHPFYPVFDVTGPAPFPDAPWAWHHEHTNATGNYALLGGVTICAGPTAESEWPLPAWTSAEESWTP